MRNDNDDAFLKHQFIDLCAQLSLDIDITDRKMIRRHNNAQRRINAICNILVKEPERASRFFLEMMRQDNPVVACTAAGYALHKNICVSEALDRLQQFSREEKNSGVGRTASMSIFAWEHRKGPDK